MAFTNTACRGCRHYNLIQDQQLFHRSTSGAEEFDIGECQFADDVALLATSCAGAEEAIGAYHSTFWTDCEF